MRKFDDTAVRKAYAEFPRTHEAHSLELRELILDTAEALELPGGVEETLKWGEPSYLPVKPKIGSTLRVGSFDADHIALYFNCQTMLVENFRSMFGNRFSYSKNRAVLFEIARPLPEDEIQTCARMALRYHLDKRL